MSFNKRLGKLTEERKFKEAVDMFHKFEKRNIKPDPITYLEMINLYSRFGLPDDAFALFGEMKRAQLKPNVKIYTALLKGIVNWRSVAEALPILQEMKESKINPTYRTYNTLLRGCLKTGEVNLALQFFEDAKKEDPHAIDPYIFEYVILCLCQALQVKEAWDVFEQMKAHGFEASPMIRAGLAFASALVCDEDKANIALLEAEQQKKPEGEEKTKEDSFMLFSETKNDEAQRILDLVKQYLPIKKIAGVKPPPDSMEKSRYMINLISKPQKLNVSLLFLNNHPTILEIGAGSGDWITTNAKKDPSCNWVSLEQKYDRVFQTWGKMMLLELKNLLVLLGEARKTLSESFSEYSVSEVVIMFPEPPAFEGSKQHLITKDFLEQVYRVLKPSGKLVILTDNRKYSKMINEDISCMSFQEEPCSDDKIPEKYKSESYFERFWKKGKITRRYFMQYTKLKPGQRADTQMSEAEELPPWTVPQQEKKRK